MGFFDKLKHGLEKTRGSIAEKVNDVFKNASEIDDDFFDELEEALIMADMGAYTASYIIEELRDRVTAKRLKTTDRVRDELKDVIRYILTRSDCRMKLETTPSVILVIGVNGVGKTTSIGKLAAYYKAQGKKVLLAAADTFRAAAIDQLDIWAQRSGCDIIKHQENSDPASVIFDACSAASARVRTSVFISVLLLFHFCIFIQAYSAGLLQACCRLIPQAWSAGPGVPPLCRRHPCLKR